LLLFFILNIVHAHFDFFFFHIEFDMVVVEPLNLKVKLRNELPGFQ
jgi:hypothetical protein